MTVGKTFESLVHIRSKVLGKGAMIRNARIEMLGDQAFITGRIILHTPGPRDGLTVWYPVSDVAALTEFPDEETARRCAEDINSRSEHDE